MKTLFTSIFLLAVSNVVWGQPGVMGTAVFSASGGSISGLVVNGNISNVTRTGAGQYAVTLTGSPTGYLPMISVGDTVEPVAAQVDPVSSYTSSGFTVQVIAGSATAYDPALVSVAVLGGPGGTGGGGGEAPAVYAMPNAAVFASPGGCNNGTSNTVCFNGGWYLKFKVTGTHSVSVNVDTTANAGSAAGNMPVLKTVAAASGQADSLYSTVQFPPTDAPGTSVMAISGLTPSTTYQVTMYGLGAPDGTQSTCYSGTICESVIQSIQADSGSAIAAATLRPKRCLFFGDSYLQGYYGVSGAIDYTWAWPHFLAASVGCEYSSVGIGSQGYVRAGNGGYPNLVGSWNQGNSANARSFGTVDYAFNCEGLNDHGESGIAGNVSSLLTAQRAAFGTGTKIFFVTPINPSPEGGDSSGMSVTAGISSAVAGSGDSGAFVVSPPAEFANVVFDSGTPATWCSVDGLHLNGGSRAGLDGNCQGMIGYSVAVAIGEIIGH
jgi:hypothetical protein